MARSWRVRAGPWSFAIVRRFADLPFLVARVRRFALRMIPKLILGRTRIMLSAP
jgi:hypothetical protein